jgi:type IV pilus assembly protein PilA
MWNRRRPRGFSLIELLIVIAIILIIIGIAVPNYHTATMNARGMAALRAVQTIQAAEVQYLSLYGHYSPSLRELGPPASGGPGASAAALIGNDLANGVKEGYRFTLSGSEGGYSVSAAPMIYRSAGTKSFYSDQSMIIRESDSAQPATASSPERP